MKRWNEDGDVMKHDLFIETMDGLVGMIVERITKEQVTNIPPAVFVASPADRDDENEYPVMTMWAIGNELPNNKHATMSILGNSIAAHGVLVSAVYMICEAWMVKLEEGEKAIEGKVSDDRRRIEIISVSGQDINGNSIAAMINFRRNPDNGSIVVTEIDKFYPAPDEQDDLVRSSLLDVLFSSYAEYLHILEFGVPIDPNDPFKMVREAVNSDS